MKKIVALVLSLVMVMGLATTAFAATTSTGKVETSSVTVKNATLYTLAEVGGSMADTETEIEEIEKTTVTGMVVEDVPMYVPVIYTINETAYAEVAKADAKFALKNNGKYVYLVAATEEDAVEEFATAVVMDKFVAPVEVTECGDAVKDAASAATYVSEDGDVYYAGGDAWAYFKGEFVSFDDETVVAFVEHEFAASKVTYRGVDALGHAIPVSVACTECKKTFNVVGTAKFDNTWVEGVNYVTDEVVDGYYIVLAGATVAAGSADATDKVESAQTFDAGIAMYVGMSVMAAAGSAVVLKKKD